ncbi:MAG: DsrE family protein [Cyclobacteriaceae bacterium]
MKYFIILIFSYFSVAGMAQEKVNPVIKSFGGIYEIPEATVKPESDLEYKIVIDVYGGSENKKKIDPSLNNVARMLNLHTVGGVSPDKMKVVLAIHGGSTFSILNDEVYKKKFGVTNPNSPLINELQEANVRLTVCGQSLMSRQIEAGQVNNNVEIATSMLTTVTTHQLKGYAVLKF